MSLENTVAAMIGGYGTDYTLRRVTSGAGPNAWTAGAETVAYTHCKGRERHGTPRTLRGGLTEAEALIVVDVATCPATPRKGDRIAIGKHSADGGADWRQIVNVVIGREGAAPRVYRIEVSK